MYNYQSGFWKYHSTDPCLTFLNHKIVKGFNKVLLTGTILIDLQKAFSTMNHKILPGKLLAIGFCEKIVVWFKSNLSDRAFKFKVNIKNLISDLSEISCGILQGSFLGLLLFLLYADDTGLTFQRKDVHTIEHQLNKDFANLCEWFVDNKVCILVKTRQNAYFLVRSFS